MKIKVNILTLFVISVLLFNSCDFLNEDDNNGNDQQIVGVEPLIQTKWSQYSPYNDLFPIANEGYTLPVDNNSGRTVTDCTNTALTQIMYYHKHPKQGIGQSTKLWPMHSYGQTEDVYVNLEIPLDWDNMLNTYTTANPGTEIQREAVATLMYHTAAAIGADGFLGALLNRLGYDRSIQTHPRNLYTDEEWEALIRKQLDLKLPVWYSGNDPQNSHTFIVDGYDKNGKFHINWGWGGRDDGWYDLDNLNPNGVKRFYNNHSIFINIKPDEGSTGSNEFMIYEFTPSTTSARQNERFTVPWRLRSFGYFIGGQAGAVLVDSNNNIVEIVGTNTLVNEWSPSNTGRNTLSCIIPKDFSPGQYWLMIATRTKDGDGEWKLVTVSNRETGAPTAINFTVSAVE